MKPVNLRKTYRHFIDTETTGLDPNTHELLEITVLTETVDPKRPWRPTLVREWTRKIKPDRMDKADPGALAINGYTADGWSDAVPFAEVAQELRLILSDGVIVGHNCRFDIDFLQASFKKAGVDVNLGHHFIDTVTLAYVHWGIQGQVEKLSLDTLRKHLSIPVAPVHSSMKDAYDCRTLFYRATQPKPWDAFTRWVSSSLEWVALQLEWFSRAFGPFPV